MLKIMWTPLAMTLLCAIAHAQAPATSTSKTALDAKPAATTSASQDASGATPIAATSVTEVKKDEPPSLKYSLDLSFGYTLQAEKQADGTQAESSSFAFTPGMSYGVYKASVFEQYNQNLKDTTKTGYWYDPAFSFSRTSFPLNDYFKFGPAISLTLPMTDGAKNTKELLYTIGGSTSFYLQTKNLGLDAWDIGYYIGYIRNFTKYSTDSAGEILTMQRIRQRINVTYKFTDSLSLKTRFQFDSNYSTEGVVRNEFLTYQTLSYAINDTVSVSAGHTNSGSALDGTTYENNIKFYDQKKSEYSASLDISI